MFVLRVFVWVRVGHVRAHGPSGTCVSSHVGLLGVSLLTSVLSATACLKHCGQSIKVWGVVCFSVCVWVTPYVRLGFFHNADLQTLAGMNCVSMIAAGVTTWGFWCVSVLECLSLIRWSVPVCPLYQEVCVYVCVLGFQSLDYCTSVCLPGCHYVNGHLCACVCAYVSLISWVSVSMCPCKCWSCLCGLKSVHKLGTLIPQPFLREFFFSAMPHGLQDLIYPTRD